jgi:hypothetical protein
MPVFRVTQASSVVLGRPVTRNLAVVAVLAALAVPAAAGGQPPIRAGDTQAEGQAKYNFRLLPRVGGPMTTFRATFKAPFPADGVNTDYTLEAVGPPGCASVFEFTMDRVRRGQRVVLRLTAFNDLYFGFRRTWCRGSYVGYVYYTSPGFQPDRLIGYFTFGVGRPPVSLAP